MPAASYPGMRGFRAPTLITIVILAIVVLAVGSAPAAADATDPTTSTALTVSPTATTPGAPVTLTATVTGVGGNPPGTVRFDSVGGSAGTAVVGSATLAPVPGSTTTSTATLVTTSFAAGSYSVTATYLSSDPFNFFTSSSAPAALAVSTTALHDTTVALTANPTTIVTGQPETFTAVVSRTDGTTPAPTGAVTFNDNGVLLGTAPLDASGIATVTVSGFIAGSHSVIALYSGDALDRSSSSPPLTFQLAGSPTAVQTTTTVTPSPIHIIVGQQVIVSAHVVQTGHTTTPPAGNSVLFYANGVLLGDAPLDGSGNASITVTGWLDGTYTITASYVGDIYDLPSTGTFPGQLNVGATPSPLTVSASGSATYGSAIPTLTPAYTGFVGGDTAAVLTTPATCTTTATSASPAGAYPITCSGASSPLYVITYAAGTLTVLPAALTVTGVNATTTAGQPIPALTATLTGFTNGETLATSGVTGSASCTTTATSSSPAGTYPITCTLGTLAAANYTFTAFVAGTLTLTTATPAVNCTDTKWDWWHDRAHHSQCESLLADPSVGQNATVSAGQKLTLVYTDETPIAGGALAPTAVLSNGQALPVTVTATSHQPLNYVDDNGGFPSSRYQSLLSFKLPANLAPGTYTILVTVHDSNGHTDQWLWQVRVGKFSGHDSNDCDWQSVFGRIFVSLGWFNRW